MPPFMYVLVPVDIRVYGSWIYPQRVPDMVEGIPLAVGEGTRHGFLDESLFPLSLNPLLLPDDV